jgi:hypothetical protein
MRVTRHPWRYESYTRRYPTRRLIVITRSGSLTSPGRITLDNDTNNDTIINMTTIDDILAQMRRNARDIRFSDLCKVCDHFFGEPRLSGSSHRIYKTPWQGDPRINIQNHKGKAKAYQVKQVLLAIERLEVGYGLEK